MNVNLDNLFNKLSHPYYQAGLVLVITLVIMVFVKLIQVGGLMDVEPTSYWLTVGTFILFFAMFNSLISLRSKNYEIYWGRSVSGFMGLVVLSGLVAWGFSGMSINEAGSYKWIFMVLTIGYIVFLAMMGAMKKIVEYAQKEEWNHPRIRSKAKKRR